MESEALEQLKWRPLTTLPEGSPLKKTTSNSGQGGNSEQDMTWERARLLLNGKSSDGTHVSYIFHSTNTSCSPTLGQDLVMKK